MYTYNLPFIISLIIEPWSHLNLKWTPYWILPDFCPRGAFLGIWGLFWVVLPWWFVFWVFCIGFCEGGGGVIPGGFVRGCFVRVGFVRGCFVRGCFVRGCFVRRCFVLGGFLRGVLSGGVCPRGVLSIGRFCPAGYFPRVFCPVALSWGFCPGGFCSRIDYEISL